MAKKWCIKCSSLWTSTCICLICSLRPITNLSVIQGRVFLGRTSTKLGLMCLAQGHNAVTPLRLEPAAPRSRVKHSTTEPLRSHSSYGTQVARNSIIWASTRENLSSGVCEQQSRRPACASAQSDQRLCYSPLGKYHI